MTVQMGDDVQSLRTWIECENTWCETPIFYKPTYTNGNGKKEYAQARKLAYEHHLKTGHTVRVEQNRTEVFFK